MAKNDTEFGPVDYLIVEFPRTEMSGEGLPMLEDLVDRGVVRILDLVFIAKDADGRVTALDIADVDPEGRLGLGAFEGAASGLIGEDDLAEAASVLDPGTSAGILVYENTWAAPFVGALRRNGAEVVATGRIPVEDLMAALEPSGSA
jgi:uncharacterized membrane protein